MKPTIEVGDIVRVTLGAEGYAIASGVELRVDHIPSATGDSWIFVSVGAAGKVDGVYYVSEGCTVEKLRDAAVAP